MIRRDPKGAAGTDYDLVVVGGGIYGTMVTLEAARRGLKPLLLERSDFGSETSENSLRIAHGGLRYLQTLDLKRFRESVRERAWLLETFPDLVQPLKCFMPLYGEGLRRRSVFAAALALNHGLGWLSGNRGSHALPAGGILDADSARNALPIVPHDGLKGAAIWYDAVMEDSERLIVEALHWACAHGATALNYVEAVGLVVSGGRAVGIEAVDRGTGRGLEYRAPVVVNAAGPWARALTAAFDREVPELWRPTLAFNLALDTRETLPGAIAVAPRSKGSPTYFLHPWKGGLLAGTRHMEYSTELRGGPTSTHVEALQHEQARAAPGLNLESARVKHVYWGLLPGQPSKRLGLATKPVIVDHGAHGGPDGLLSVSGVKFTTARDVAESALKILWGRNLKPAIEVQRSGNPTVERARQAVASKGWKSTETVRLLATLAQEEAVVTQEDLVRRRLSWSPFREQPGEVDAPDLMGTDGRTPPHLPLAH